MPFFPIFFLEAIHVYTPTNYSLLFSNHPLNENCQISFQCPFNKRTDKIRQYLIKSITRDETSKQEIVVF